MTKMSVLSNASKQRLAEVAILADEDISILIEHIPGSQTRAYPKPGNGRMYWDFKEAYDRLDVACKTRAKYYRGKPDTMAVHRLKNRIDTP